MALVKWKNRESNDPWTQLASLQDEINSLFNYDHFPTAAGLFDRNVSPAMDVIENDETMTLICELPGVNEKDIEVTLTSNVLTIKGEKKSSRERKSGKFLKQETVEGSFQRTLSLPATVSGENIEAHMENGLLKVVIPKKEEAKPRQISVAIK